jgi:hypothetical protein
MRTAEKEILRLGQKLFGLGGNITVGLVLMPFAQKYAQMRRKFFVWDRNDSVWVEILQLGWS